jgi:hypothetical protein
MLSKLDLTALYSNTPTILATLAAASASLIAVAITLLVFVPAFVELARSQAKTFLQGEDARRLLRRELAYLSNTIWLFSLVFVLSMIGLICQSLFLAFHSGIIIVDILLAVALFLAFIAFGILIRTSYIIARISISVIMRS